MSNRKQSRKNLRRSRGKQGRKERKRELFGKWVEKQRRL